MGHIYAWMMVLSELRVCCKETHLDSWTEVDIYGVCLGISKNQFGVEDQARSEEWRA